MKQNNNIPFSSEGCICEDDIKYNGVTTEEKFKDGASIDEMKEFIYSFIKYYDTLKNELFNEKKNIFTERMKNRKRLYVQLKLI
ncbi:hypothetical protein PFHG_04049 [Plasmodium falciparum HB3]|uniref:Plasmodium RESA N-terminal domain-containing protein n=1 Tax=Plasmodium falciparum (isolate HB3) TaxID=137071 RepID=A0A0L7KGT2_PLAFX|nr:hypothetical protein PFHG_04049 [Plasmodium falciparum HB3]